MSSAFKLGAAALLCSMNMNTSATAADGPQVITQATALSGKVSPYDAPGFPVTITRPGSYRLGSNLQVTAGASGIRVTASDVSLDMDGFTMTGADVALSGIFVNKGVNNFSVRDGSINNFKSRGISAEHVSFTRVSGMTIYLNGSDGAYLGMSARVSGSDISSNLGRGLYCLNYCHIEGNMIAANGAEGVHLYEGVLIGNTIVANKLLGVDALPPSGAAHNVISSNNGHKPEQTKGLTSMNPNVCASSWHDVTTC